MDDERAIITALVRKPTTTAFSIYADWLEERGSEGYETMRLAGALPIELRFVAAKLLDQAGRWSKIYGTIRFGLLPYKNGFAEYTQKRPQLFLTASTRFANSINSTLQFRRSLLQKCGPETAEVFTCYCRCTADDTCRQRLGKSVRNFTQLTPRNSNRYYLEPVHLMFQLMADLGGEGYADCFSRAPTPQSNDPAT